jgi:hypothetical protein
MRCGAHHFTLNDTHLNNSTRQQSNGVPENLTALLVVGSPLSLWMSSSFSGPWIRDGMLGESKQ